MKVPSQSIRLRAGKRLYFSSDFHLGAPDAQSSREREKRIVQWLEQIRSDAQVVFLVGDIFDFWFEYKQAVPKGFVRLLGKLAELADEGIQLIIFTGNHDMWMSDYLTHELPAEVHRNPVRYEVRTEAGQEHTLLVGHGDGLGPGDRVYKQLKKVFENPLARWSFRQLHPDLGIRLATGWSRRSRASNLQKGEEQFMGKEREWLYQYCLATENFQHHDYYIFGHRHLPLDLPVNANSRYINLGEWIRHQTYAVFDGTTVELSTFRP
jgi:UDP-2,3-diacylglucosamine hydrolase